MAEEYRRAKDVEPPNKCQGHGIAQWATKPQEAEWDVKTKA